MDGWMDGFRMVQPLHPHPTSLPAPEPPHPGDASSQVTPEVLSPRYRSVTSPVFQRKEFDLEQALIPTRGDPNPLEGGQRPMEAQAEPSCDMRWDIPTWMQQHCPWSS